MALVYSFVLKNSFQKKPLLPKNRATQPRNDSKAQYYTIVSCMYVIFEVVYAFSSKLCIFEILHLYFKILTDCVSWWMGGCVGE